MRWLRTGQVAARLGWASRDAVRDMCEASNSSHFRNARVDAGGQWRVPESDVAAYERFRDELTARRRSAEPHKKNDEFGDDDDFDETI